MAKGKFIFGFALGIAAGLAGKYIYENRDTVVKVVNEKSSDIRDEVTDFVEYASKKAGNIGKEVAKFADEYSDYAKQQFEEFKSSVGKDFFDDEEETEDAPVGDKA